MIVGRKALFIAEGVTLAHVGRAITLAEALHARGFDVVLACDPRYARFTDALPFAVRPLASVAPEAFAAALRHGRPVYSSDTLARYAADDLALLSELRPDVVIGDFRLSLSVSARVARVPYVNVTNAYWSPYARPRFRMPDLAFARGMPQRLADPLFRAVRPIAFALHARPLNRVRRRHGLAPLPHDVRAAYCDGDVTLYADLPQLIPLYEAPPAHRHIGPVAWSPRGTSPPWWDDVMRGEPPVYVSLGSSGAVTRLPQILAALLPFERPIVVASAGRGAALPAQARVYMADFVPGDAIAAKACAVVCNGGSPATMQALAHGVPVLGIASNLDQYLNMGYVETAGAGMLLGAARASGARLRAAVRRLLDDASLRERARALASLLAACDAAATFSGAVGQLVAREPQISENTLS
jgi:UDP:flavonoid glycosyltransferase YjiC (YdhE family)